MNCITQALFLSCFIAISVFSPSLAFGDRISLNSVMTEEDQKNMGLDKATTAQKKAFEEWLAAWTLKVIEQGPTYHSSLNLQAWVEGWPKSVAPVKTEDHAQIAQENKIINRRIDKNLEDGAILELKDGSVWRIAPFDTYKTRRWLRGDEIEWSIGEPKVDARNPYRIYNVTRQQVAYGKQEKPPHPSGQKEEVGEDYYKGSIRVVSVRQEGGIVDLENNTSWKIIAGDQIRTEEWKPNDRIRLGKTSDVMYNTSLQNLDSGETVKAKQLKTSGR